MNSKSLSKSMNSIMTATKLLLSPTLCREMITGWEVSNFGS